MNRIRKFSPSFSGIVFPGIVLATVWGPGGPPIDGAQAAQPGKGPVTLHADKPNEFTFEPRRTRFARVVIQRTADGNPCLDELEVYGADQQLNFALASRGAKATASSCLSGYDIHRVEHLNDGKYGNSHSWIAATSRVEWARIELPEPTEISRVVISRDRDGQYHDRVPIQFEIQLSADGEAWETACRVQGRAAVASHPGSQYNGPFRLPDEAGWDSLLAYAFDCERSTWERISKDDHLSPLSTDRPAFPGGGPYWGRIARLSPLERTLVQLEEMIARLAGQGLEVSAEREQLAALRARQAVAPPSSAPDAAADQALYREARLAKRRLMFRDPELDGARRILFVKRFPYHSSHNYSDVLDSRFDPGGGVCVLEIPRIEGRLEPAEARLRMLFDSSQGIARDPVVDFDARTIYFAYRPDVSPVAGWAPYWHLMAVDAEGGAPRQLTDGPYHDYYPCPLPDGGMAFISTRVKARFLCWRPQAFVLFRMDADGSNIRALSHANLSEWTPAMMRDGRILWTRSEYLDKGADFGHTLWAIRPDGTQSELVFGNNTPNCYINGHEVPGSREILCTLFSHGGDHNGPIGLVDPDQGRFDSAAVTNITPDVKPHYNMSWPRYECFRDPVPIARDYFLVSHAPGERFGLYLIDRYGNRELLYLDPAICSMSPTPLRPRTRPPVLPSAIDPELAKANLGQFTLLDVYQGLEPQVQRGKVKYLRVCQEVRADLLEQGDGQCQADHPLFQDWYATPIHKVFGPFGWPSYVAKSSLGLVPIGEDGAATFQAPAGKVLYFEVLDQDFNELQRMRSVVQLQPGERRSCIGCHENRRMTPSPTLASIRAAAPVALEPPPWGTEPFSYQRVVQPVWDARCVQCHDAADKQGLNLTGTLDADKVPASYRTLIAGGWVHYFNCQYNLRHHKAEPMTFGSLQSKLWPLLDAGHYDAHLTDAEMRAVKCWIDLNCPLWPDYCYRPKRPASLGELIGR